MKQQHPAAAEDTNSVIMDTAIPAPAVNSNAANTVAPTPAPRTNPAATTPTVAAPRTIPQTKAGRRAKFSTEEGLVFVREVGAYKAHISPTEDTRERYELATSEANATKRLSTRLTWIALQDRHKRLQELLDQNYRLSGIGGEVTEMGTLRELVKDDRVELAAEKSAKTEKEEKREREERNGWAL
ncbi:unnamed protein product [Agarophyton chilense]|eukprot:gb/GEZJ01006399.1/.p1 GENE.gb/GEZJ01006399.1/~~gb/GEZJ01006399.1/.p1  ORF type:complete len:185 (-),score=29.02 gb/GEZJ01006399.1/:524-1078(-)